MNAGYDRATGSLSLCFPPSQSFEAAVLMQLVWEEEWKKGTLVPDYGKDFFDKLAIAKGETPIAIEFEFLEFAIAFLKEACTELTESDAGMTALEKFVVELSGLCSAGKTIQ